MSGVLPPSLSLEGQIDYCTGVIAALKAEDELKALASPWEKARTALRKSRDSRDEARDAALEAQAVVRVRDARWDQSLTSLSGKAYDLAGKDPRQPPYVHLFSTIKAKDAVNLGPAKATLYGDALLKKAKEAGAGELSPLTHAFAAANTALDKAARKRDDMTGDSHTHEVRRQKHLADLEHLIALTEVGILHAAPGNKALVRAILVPPRSTPRQVGGKDGELAGDGHGEGVDGDGAGMTQGSVAVAARP
jgi:hypothetical protein